MTATLLSQPAFLNASISSSQVFGVKALYFSGRLMVMRATPSRTSNRMSLYLSIVDHPCMVRPPDTLMVWPVM